MSGTSTHSMTRYWGLLHARHGCDVGWKQESLAQEEEEEAAQMPEDSVLL